MTLVLLLELIRTGSLALLATLGRASLEGGLVAGVVWATCRVLPSLPAAVRTWLWWLVSLKLLLGVLPVPALPLPWLPATAVTWTARASGGRPRGTAVVRRCPRRRATLRRRWCPSLRRPVPVSLPYASFWPVLVARRLAGPGRPAGPRPLPRAANGAASASPRRARARGHRPSRGATRPAVRPAGHAARPGLAAQRRAAHHGRLPARDSPAGVEYRDVLTA